jgi:hypothetical protein
VGEGDDDGFVDGLGVRGGSIGDLGESGAVGFEGAADADEAGGDGLGVGPGRRRMPMPPRPGVWRRRRWFRCLDRCLGWSSFQSGY